MAMLCILLLVWPLLISYFLLPVILGFAAIWAGAVALASLLIYRTLKKHGLFTRFPDGWKAAAVRILRILLLVETWGCALTCLAALAGTILWAMG